MRIDYGPGYRVYFKKGGREVVIQLAGGDKSTQAKDIKAALRLARNLLAGGDKSTQAKDIKAALRLARNL